MEEFKFTIDPEKFKKNVHEKLNDQEEVNEESPMMEETVECDETEISETEPSTQTLQDVVVFEDDVEESVNAIGPSKQEQKAEKKRIKQEKKQAKKEAKKEKNKHKGNNILFYIAFALLFIIIGAALCLTVFFNVETAEVVNSKIYTEDEVVKASGLNFGENVFLISSETLENNICNKLPYIKSVNVSKGLNNKITFEVTETYDYMVVDSNGGFAVLSPEKKVLKFIGDTYPKHLVYVYGLKISNVHPGETAVFIQENASKAIETLIPILVSSGFDKVKSISVNDLSAIKFVYDNRIVVNVGTTVDLEYKLSFAKQALESSVEDNAVGTLNLAQLSSKNREIQFRKEQLYTVKQLYKDEAEQ